MAAADARDRKNEGYDLSMTVRRTVSLPDELDRAVLAAAGDNYSGFAQRALRNELVVHDLDLIAVHAGADVEDDIAAAADADVEAELAAQGDMRRRAS
jgi:hypothetical protein